MPFVLLVGEDDLLLRTRAAVLHTTGAETVISGPHSALTMMEEHPFDLLLLCHSLPEKTALQLIASFRAISPANPILRMTSLRYSEKDLADDRVEPIPSSDPDRLVKRSAELLGITMRSPSAWRPQEKGKIPPPARVS